MRFRWRVDLRGEESASTGENGDVDVVALRYFLQQAREAEVQVRGHGIELLLLVQGNDGNVAPVLELDGLFCHGCLIRLYMSV